MSQVERSEIFRKAYRTAQLNHSLKNAGIYYITITVAAIHYLTIPVVSRKLQCRIATFSRDAPAGSEGFCGTVNESKKRKIKNDVSWRMISSV